ncbi:MAG: hypothetical protein LC775_11360, partial [Acidobacteria bacterium]|nr:hypothetical protein [Acidobacteriota bacterium]
HKALCVVMGMRCGRRSRRSSLRYLTTARRVARATVSLDVIGEVDRPAIDHKEDRCATIVLQA